MRTGEIAQLRAKAQVRPRRILVVEDEPDIRELLAELLGTGIENAVVEAREDGPSALRAIAATPPDLIVTDFKMPGMNGLEFLQASRAMAPETPRVLMTAYPDLEIATRAINEAHIENFLAKPVEPEELIAKVVRIFQIEEARLERERSLARTIRALQTAIEAEKK